MPTPKDVYTLSDLRNWTSLGKDLKPPARLAVFGDPVEHSLSPQMHNPALRAADIDCQYIRLQIKADELVEALRTLGKAGFIGTNVTIPHKSRVFAEVDEMTEVARRIGAVNTVLVSGDKLLGHNTDGPGLKRAVREEFSLDLEDMRVMILGAGGGAGRAASVQCAMDQCERLVLVNRTVEKAEMLAEELRNLDDNTRLEGPAARLEAIPWNANAIEKELGQIDLIVNCTNIGMNPVDPELIPQRLLQPHHLIYDMVYSPPRTRLMAAAESVGAKATNGMSMLLWQGALAFEFWFSREAPVEAMRRGLMQS